jgi:hypothetical protein
MQSICISKCNWICRTFRSSDTCQDEISHGLSHQYLNFVLKSLPKARNIAFLPLHWGGQNHQELIGWKYAIDKHVSATIAISFDLASNSDLNHRNRRDKLTRWIWVNELGSVQEIWCVSWRSTEANDEHFFNDYAKIHNEEVPRGDFPKGQLACSWGPSDTFMTSVRHTIFLAWDLSGAD